MPACWRKPRLPLGLLAALAFAGLAPGGAGCDTVDLGDPPADFNACRPDPQFFYERVWPEYLAKDFGGVQCGQSGCHDATSGRQLVLTPPTTMPQIPLPPDWETVYRSASEQMQCTNVAESPLLRRPENSNHGGGKLINEGGPEFQLVRSWIEARP